MRDRQCFLGFFIICLALAAGVFFASLDGLPGLIWRADISMMTSVIALWFLGSTFAIGQESWSCSPHSSDEFAWFAGEQSVRLALVGTTIGLLSQAKILMSGTAGLLPLSTSLYTTAVGISASIVLNLMAYNLRTGIRRADRRVAG
jgi:hypothetical protein